jgi:hypothetical protein
MVLNFFVKGLLIIILKILSTGSKNMSSFLLTGIYFCGPNYKSVLSIFKLYQNWSIRASTVVVSRLRFINNFFYSSLLCLVFESKSYPKTSSKSFKWYNYIHYKKKSRENTETIYSRNTRRHTKKKKTDVLVPASSFIHLSL